MRAATSRTIGGHSYEVRQLPATPAYLMFLDLGKILAPSLAAGVASVAGNGKLAEALDAEVDGNFIIRAVEGLMDRMDNAKVQSIIEQLANHTSVSLGERSVELDQQFETHFAGRIGEMLQWLAFALEVNFGDFLSGCRDKVRAVLRELMTPQTTGSHGPSGDLSSSV